MNIQYLLTERAQETEKKDPIVRPLFFRLYEEEDRDALMRLLQENPSISVYNRIEAQLRELVKSLAPARQFSEDELQVACEQHLDGRPLMEYGVWVYYPWSDRLVHILDEDEFIELRTNRNQLKITREERDLLAKKKTGIIGLSVGQSVALTMALERATGELRIADFDSLDLSNLNRIRAGVHNLGLPKVTMVAREIAEIDPFLKVVCFYDGLHDGNMEQFFLEGGKLDLLIDECDSFDVKLSSRRYARSQEIPVVMDTSDRGLLDIERFDLEPNRPLFHGIINEEEIPQGEIPPAQRVEMAMKIVGAESISERMKISLPQIGKTISTWPQLASSVMLGGAIATEISRKIALDELRLSGRFYVDVNDIIKD